MFDLSLTDEQEALIQTAREFARNEVAPVAGHLDEEGKFPTELMNKAFELGLLNFEVPEAYGGLGLSCLTHALILEEIAWACAGVNTTLAANMLGSMPLLIAGNEAQKKKWLGQLIAGDGGKPVFACYACSEPDAGSDVAGMRTRVEKKGDEYILNGQKRWITNGGVAKFCTTFATSDPKLKHKGISAFVVDMSTPGVKVGKKENKMGQRSSLTNDIIFEDVRIPKKNLLGEEGNG